MLTIYRRHRNVCARRSESVNRVQIDGDLFSRAVKCSCPLWVDGFLGDREIRRSLKTRNYEKALETVREWGATAREPKQRGAFITIVQGCEKFEADAGARRLNEATIYKYKLLFKQLKSFAAHKGLRFLVELDVDSLGTFRAEWKDGPRSSLKKLERLRAFLGFAQRRKWIAENPAQDLKAPKTSLCPTLPFTQEDMVRILAAAEKRVEQTSVNGRDNARRIRALILLLRYTGMRIGDVVSLTVDRFSGNRLFLYTAKTGTPVHTVLPDFVVRAIETTPRMTEHRYFWSGAGKLPTAVRVWETRLRKVFDLAKVPNAHAHRFRDTFAVELLLAGVPMERVSILLGHTSIRVTERHYSPWVRSRQEQLEADIASAWSRDPMVILETKGTPQVHAKRRVLN